MSSGSCFLEFGPAISIPFRPVISTSSGVRLYAACVSPSTCFSSFSLSSPSKYCEASSFGLIPSAIIRLNLSRFEASFINATSSSVSW